VLSGTPGFQLKAPSFAAQLVNHQSSQPNLIQIIDCQNQSGPFPRKFDFCLSILHHALAIMLAKRVTSRAGS
jgi:hypothetical protein